VACGVPEEVLRKYGAASAEVGQAQAEAARTRFNADIGLGISQMEDKSDGRIFFAVDTGKERMVVAKNFFGYRVQLKRRIVTAALEELRRTLNGLD
jgi:nicotinamide-nucleotide amidase